MRLLIYTAAILVLLLPLYVHVFGQAVDSAIEDHMLITRNGVTLDCERITDVAGNVFYDSCVRVP